MRAKEQAIEKILLTISATTLLVLAGIFIFLLWTGSGAFLNIPTTKFFDTIWNPDAYTAPRWGIIGLLIGTCMVSLLGLLIAIPISIMCALYLVYIAPPRVREIIKPSIEMIAGIPSVVLGFIGLAILAPFIAQLFGISSGLNALTASLIVALMTIPTIVSISEDILTSLPKEFMEASLALGATRWQTIRRALIPAASSGIIAAIMLGLGRAVGETMAVLMVAGNSLALPRSLLDPARPMTATIAIEIKEVVQGSLHYKALFAIALILFLLTFVINLIADLIIERNTRKYRW